jgi:hypothetical protein
MQRHMFVNKHTIISALDPSSVSTYARCMQINHRIHKLILCIAIVCSLPNVASAGVQEFVRTWYNASYGDQPRTVTIANDFTVTISGYWPVSLRSFGSASQTPNDPASHQVLAGTVYGPNGFARVTLFLGGLLTLGQPNLQRLDMMILHDIGADSNAGNWGRIIRYQTTAPKPPRAPWNGETPPVAVLP